MSFLLLLRVCLEASILGCTVTSAWIERMWQIKKQDFNIFFTALPLLLTFYTATESGWLVTPYIHMFHLCSLWPLILLTSVLGALLNPSSTFCHDWSLVLLLFLADTVLLGCGSFFVQISLLEKKKEKNETVCFNSSVLLSTDFAHQHNGSWWVEIHGTNQKNKHEYVN